MYHAIKCWRSIQAQLAGKRILLFLDFDGTLSPLASSPAEARIPAETLKLLKRLAAAGTVKLAIVSGRELHDLIAMIRLSGIYYAGNHGKQVHGPRLQWRYHIPPELRKRLANLKSILLSSFHGMQGVLIEDKSDSVAVHYRNVPSGKLKRFHCIIKNVSLPFLKSGMGVLKGKKVVEFSPVMQWDKGWAVLWLISRMAVRGSRDSCVSVYIGDDYTDESAFRVLRKRGITIRVGKGRQTEAEYCLSNTRETYLFLRNILMPVIGSV